MGTKLYDVDFKSITVKANTASDARTRATQLLRLRLQSKPSQVVSYVTLIDEAEND